MKAIILAAGLGSRLGPKSQVRPKALVEVGESTIIQHQLEALSSEGVGPVVVVVGHGADQIREVLGESVEYVENGRPGETNSLFSLWLAREWLEGDVLLLNCDVLFHPKILKSLLSTEGSALAYDSISVHGAEQTKIGLHRGRVTDLGKDLPETGARGENLGVIKLDAAGAALLRKRANAIIGVGDETSWVTEAVRSILAETHVTGVNVAGLPWVEIDFPYDLDRARREVWPAIRRDLDPRAVFRRLRRVAAVTLAPILLAGTAFAMSSQLGPASVDWETLTPHSGEKVRVERTSKTTTQSWWLLEQGESITVDAFGDEPLRLEARPLLDNVLDTASFVIALTLDGEPFRFEAKRRTRASGTRLGSLIVGKRDREEYTLSPGIHELKVAYLAGTSHQVIVRVRQPE